ncbi:myc-associated zinc finger protein-like [Panicum virgatum]|uniref:myc-associated zinc finger protein-like n=1 Tax=Panicum virgatum TaxID=38727 RepID=UPI0019D53D83|nr:myc-associated zinc finger protein-like [Panicum virgatum]
MQKRAIRYPSDSRGPHPFAESPAAVRPSEEASAARPSAPLVAARPSAAHTFTKLAAASRSSTPSVPPPPAPPRSSTAACSSQPAVPRPLALRPRTLGLFATHPLALRSPRSAREPRTRTVLHSLLQAEAAVDQLSF